MADLSISNAASLDHSTIASGDLLPVVDVSAASGSKGSKITVGELAATVNGALLGASNVFTASGAASSPALSLTGSLFTGGTSATTKPFFLIEPGGTPSSAWSTGGTALGINVASGFSGRYLSMQTNGLERIWIEPTPGIYSLASLFLGGYGNNVVHLDSQGLNIMPGSGYITLQTTGAYLAWNNGGTGQSNTRLYGPDGGFLDQRAPIAQTFRIYESYTDSANYARLTFSTAAGGAYSIKPEAAGTGVLRDLSLGASGGRTLVQSSMLQIGGNTSSYPALATESGVLQVLLADGSGYAPFDALSYSVGGTPGASGTATSTNTLTIVNGIITQIS